MHLHGAFGDADSSGDLLVQATVRNHIHYLALPRTQRTEALPDGGQIFFTLPASTIASQADFDRIEKILIAERFRQELNGASLHCLHGHGDVAVPGDEDDRYFLVRVGELALEIKTASPGQSNIEHQACWTR